MKTLAFLSIFAVAVAQSQAPPAIPQNLTVNGAGSVVPGNENCKNVGGTDGPAALPLIKFCTDRASNPAPGPTVTVAAGASLQSAVNNAACGSRIKIQGGSAFTLTSLPNKNCDNQHWIYLMPDDASFAALPPEGHRAPWCYSGVASLVGRPSEAQYCPAIPVHATWALNISTSVQVQGSNYRFIGVELVQASTSLYNMFVYTAGIRGFVIDQYWAHGITTSNINRVALYDGVGYFAAIDGAMTDFHCDGTVCNQSGGFNEQSGPGVDNFHDNFLESGGGPIGFGGGPNNYGTPCDIEVFNNEFFKPLQWQQGEASYTPNPSGRPWEITNSFETKNSCRLAFYQNKMSNVSGGFSQSGWHVLVTPKNQSNGTTNVCPTCEVTDFVSWGNHGDHSGGAYQIANAPSDTSGIALAGMRYSIHDDLFTDLGYVGCFKCGPFYLQFTSTINFLLSQVLMNHETFVLSPTSTSYMMIIGGPMAPNTQPNMWIINSIMPAGPYGVQSPGGGTDCSAQNATSPLTRFSGCWTAPYQYTKNLIPCTLTGTPPVCAPHQQGVWPAGNLFTASQSTVGYVDMANGNYSLLPTSSGYKAATDGKDIGADQSKVAQ
jgi:hypothetical protein